MGTIEPPVWKNGPDTYDQDKKNTMLYDALIRARTITRVAFGAEGGFDFELTINGGIRAIALAKEKDLDMSELTKAQVLSLVVYGDPNQIKES